MRRFLWIVAMTLGLANAAHATSQVPVTRDEITLSFAPVVKRVMPAVVNIYTRHTEKIQASPFMNDPFFNQFFWRRRRAEPAPQPRYPVAGLGASS